MTDPLSRVPPPRCQRHEEPLILECGTCRRLETDLRMQAIVRERDTLLRQHDVDVETFRALGECGNQIADERDALRRERDEARRENVRLREALLLAYEWDLYT